MIRHINRIASQENQMKTFFPVALSAAALVVMTFAAMSHAQQLSTDVEPQAEASATTAPSAAPATLPSTAPAAAAATPPASAEPQKPAEVTKPVEQKPAQEVGAAIGKEQMDELVKLIEANAQVWAEGQEPDTEILKKLRSVTYDETTVPLLAAQLNARRDPLQSLYVADMLLEPLLLARTPVIEKSLPAVKEFVLRAAYKPLPVYSPAQLKMLELPVGGEAMLRVADAVEKRRSEKHARELPIKLNNEMVAQLRRKLVLLLLAAEKPAEDKLVMKLIAQAESQKILDYAKFLEIITADAYKLDEKRAKAFYDDFRLLARQLVLVKDNYSSPSEVQLNPSGNSRFNEQEDYPAIRLIDAANKLTPASNLPALKVPARNEIDALREKNKPRTR